jgi:26S proteasome regulatory subunit N2
VVGMLVFCQYWYWFPLSHFLSLAFQPTALIGLNKDLEMPVVQFRSNAKPSTYGYPAPLEEKKKEDKEKVATAILSITVKQKRKDAEKKKKDDEKMEVDEKKEEETKKEGEKEKKEEALFEQLSNPARVVKSQLRVVQLEDTKYKPVKDISIGGMVMLENVSGEEDTIVEPMVVVKTSDKAEQDEGAEPEPPQPFMYTED